MITKQETLNKALAARKEEVMSYQINIDNYKLAMEKIEQRHAGTDSIDVAMREFHMRLKDLHGTSVVEQAKAKLMLEVICEQLEAK